jgi:hypothetical protein
MLQVFEEIRLKAKVLRPTIEKVFATNQAFKFIDAEQIVLGFFYFYIFKDFVLREVIFWFAKSNENGNDPNQLKHIFIDKISIHYDNFIQMFFVQWTNLLLHTEVF